MLAHNAYSFDELATRQNWVKSRAVWVTNRTTVKGKRLDDILEYGFGHSASRRGLGFQEEDHHFWPKWLGGPTKGPLVNVRMGIHRGAQIGIHQHMNRWLVDRAVIPREFVNNTDYVHRAIKNGNLSISKLKRELYLFYKTNYPELLGVVGLLEEASRGFRF